MVPSALVTRAMMALCVPFFAGLMSTVTVSPNLSELFVHPARSRMPGARPSASHSTLPPLPSSTVMCSQVCGFTHSNSVTTPVTVMTLVTSYSTLLWWDCAGPAHRRTAANTRDVTTARLIVSLLGQCG